jgi:aldehyde dehydrogenase (NAD+)
VFVERSIKEEFSEKIKECIKRFFNGDPQHSEDFARIITDWHTERLSKLCTTHNGKLVSGGDFSLKDKYISPTVVEYNTLNEMEKSVLAEGEIFGPILYFTLYDNLTDVINYIKRKERPLVAYYFGTVSKTKERIMNEISSGALVCNDTLVHFVNHNLPFGGVGFSGMGAYHGKWGFDSLSHKKAVMECPKMLLKLRHPPFKPNQKILNFMFKYITFSQYQVLKVFLYIGLLIVGIYFRSCIFGQIGRISGFIRNKI